MCCSAQEENGATGNKGLAGLLGNPVLSTSVAGLATAATAFAAVEVVACTVDCCLQLHMSHTKIVLCLHFVHVNSTADRMDEVLWFLLAAHAAVAAQARGGTARVCTLGISQMSGQKQIEGGLTL